MKTNQILKNMKVVTWILFIGLCIRTGAMLISLLISLFIQSEAAKDLYMGMDLSDLYTFSRGHYIAMAGIIILLSGLKAYLFFWVAKITSRINFTHPFSRYTAGLIAKMSRIALQIGVTAFVANIYVQWLKRVFFASAMDETEFLKNYMFFTYKMDGTEFVFLAGILFVIAVIFKKGIELQSENELTI